MKLVPDWRDVWKWSSTHVVGLAAVVPIAWSQLPHEFKSIVPQEWMPYIGGLLFVAFLVARLRDQ